jgi:hypothetical protein
MVARRMPVRCVTRASYGHVKPAGRRAA